MALSDAEKKERKRISRAKSYIKNKDKIKARQKKYRDNNKEEGRKRNKKLYESKRCNPEFKRKMRESFLKRHYGISIQDYDGMYIEQGGRCAICGVHQSKLTRRLEIDHCHETLLVRGLLCHNCNVGLGHFNNDIDLLENVIQYLKEAYNGS